MLYAITRSLTVRVILLVLVVILVLTGRSVLALLVAAIGISTKLAAVKANFYQKMIKRSKPRRKK